MMYLSPTIFDEQPGLVAGFSTRLGGVSKAPYASLNLSLSQDDNPAHVHTNRRQLFEEAIGFSVDQIAFTGQVHGNDLLDVTAPGVYRGYDGMVTRARGLLLCTTAADCANILLADAEAGVIGACHAGWRGAVEQITPKTVAWMQEHGAVPARMRAYISPCISAENFEVGPEVAAQFDKAFVVQRPGWPKPHVDLKAALVAQLVAAGLDEAHLEVAPQCTFGDVDTFFSHRAEKGTTGRMMGFIGMKASD